jgi:hypothetical protein
VVISPNPFYQIYEGAALLAGARPFFLNTLPENDFKMDWSRVPEDLWEQVNLVYVCSPGNPTGKVMSLTDWKALFDLSDQHGFVIAADECYSEIYFEEGAPPLGALTAAQQLGRGLRNLIVFNSLSKRSNVPGLRSGMVAGDAALMKSFLLYRTYHGSAMSPVVQSASIAAWNDETHVIENRRQYAEKFATVMPMLQDVLQFDAPDAAFYLWARVPGGDDATFARELYRTEHVTVLPGSFLARDAAGINRQGPSASRCRQPGRLRRGGRAHGPLRRRSCMNRSVRNLAAGLLLAPVLAWADAAAVAEQAAMKVLVEENVLSVYLTTSDTGRLTLLFGSGVAAWQINAVLKKLEQEPAIKGVTHAHVDTDFCFIR